MIISEEILREFQEFLKVIDRKCIKYLNKKLRKFGEKRELKKRF